MKKNSLRVLALLVVLAMSVALFAGCNNQSSTPDSTPSTEPSTSTEPAGSGEDTSEPDTTTSEYPQYPEKQVPAGSDAAASYTGGDTLVVAYEPFSSKFSPFFATTGYDMDVVGMTAISLLSTDREGNIVYNGIDGETRAYNGVDYTYTGVADLVVIENEDGTVDFDFNLATNVKWSDGEPVTIDDVIFTIYALCDPTYDGPSTLYAVPIEGVDEYRSSMAFRGDYILSLGTNNTDFSAVSQEDYDEYWATVNAAGVKFAQDIADNIILYYGEAYGVSTVAQAAALWAFGGLAEDATYEDFWNAILAAYSDGNGATALADIDAETFIRSLTELVEEELGDKADYYKEVITLNASANTIPGVIKTSDHSLRIHTTGVDAPAVYNLGITITPLHYYGDPSKYDYENGKFGFDKGDLSQMRDEEHMTVPVGAGPYKFVSYENNVVTFTANENYYKGEPKIQTVLFQVVPSSDRVTGLASGSIDAGEVSITTAVAETIASYNSNGELVDGDVIYTSLVDNLGYGYIGINAANVNVGGVPDSEASKDLRKGLMTVLAVYRDSAIASYYGELAAIIEYPISNTSWAAPRPADAGYQKAYSVDVDGNAIYTNEMTEEERYDAALEAAIGFFKAAGYTFDEASGKFTAAPEGASLQYELIIPGSGNGEHPAFAIVTDAHNALAEIGIDLVINDPADSNVLWDALASNTHQLWTAAWGSTVDPDMYQVYHSSNAVGAGGTDSNSYNLTSDEMDELIMEGRSTYDQTYRKEVYTEALNLILDWAVELPTYQRKLAICFSATNINLETLTPDQTPFWGWMAEVETLEMN